MYYPKSQIKTNLYTKGKEYVISSTKEEYRGYYYQVSTGNLFTGKTPQDPNGGLVLSPIEDITESTSSNTITDPVYNSIKNTTSTPSITSPTSIYPQPTERDYEIGEFQRYFLLKTNEIRFIEVTKEVYNQYYTKNPKVQFSLYFPFTLSWKLTGDKQKVYEVNEKNSKETEVKYNLRGLTQYLKHRFTQFYKNS